MICRSMEASRTKKVERKSLIRDSISQQQRIVVAFVIQD